MRWEAKILDIVPISGNYPEYKFESPILKSSKWMWVQFEHDEGKIWYGYFRIGSNPIGNKAITVNSSGFVIAGGAGYWVDLENHSIQYTHDYPYLNDAIGINGKNIVLIADFNNVYGINEKGIFWSSPRIAWDGIRFIKDENNIVTGIAETGHGEEGDKEFNIDTINWVAKGGYIGQID